MTAATTRIGVDLVDGRARVTDLDAGEYLSPRLLAIRDATARVALVGVRATLLAGDDLRLTVRVGPGARLELIEPAGMVAYDARGGSASWAAELHIALGGSVTWAAQPFVVADGANVRRHLEVVLDAGSSALLRETLVLGRSNEFGGPLRATTNARHDGRELLIEDLDLRDPRLRTAPGILGTRRVVATTMLLGITPPTVAETQETVLAGPGALARVVTAHTHEADSALTDTWCRWRRLQATRDVAAPCGMPASSDR